MMNKRELAREITKFCFDNNIFDVNKHYYGEMIDAVEINLSKPDYIETISKVLENKVIKNSKYIKKNKHLKEMIRALDLEKKVID